MLAGSPSIIMSHSVVVLYYILLVPTVSGDID